MSWSIPDILLLTAGLITLAIALLPMRAIAENTRWAALAVGAGLVVIALVTPNMATSIYPGVVILAPLIALLAFGLVVRQALRRSQHPPSRLLDLEGPVEADADREDGLDADELPLVARAEGDAGGPSAPIRPIRPIGPIRRGARSRPPTLRALQPLRPARPIHTFSTSSRCDTRRSGRRWPQIPQPTRSCEPGWPIEGSPRPLPRPGTVRARSGDRRTIRAPTVRFDPYSNPKRLTTRRVLPVVYALPLGFRLLEP